MPDIEQLTERVKELTGWKYMSPVKVVTDTTQWMNITRGHIIRFDDDMYVVKGNATEARFGIKDQPKYWVFNTLDMKTGAPVVIKTVFYEEFHVRIGLFKMRCFRSPKKEGRVLDIVRGDDRFMQGVTRYDDNNNPVRVIDFIKGETLFDYIANIKKDHEQYFHEDLPGILRNLRVSIDAILFLHENGTCHGDIRNDHIIIEKDTGKYRWIDFDFTQEVSDFDIWSIGNILGYAVGQGIVTFHAQLKNPDLPQHVKDSLTPDDAAGFYEYRIMNLKKLYPYIPKKLEDLLLHFTIKPKDFYSHMSQFVNEYHDMLDTEFPNV